MVQRSQSSLVRERGEKTHHCLDIQHLHSYQQCAPLVITIDAIAGHRGRLFRIHASLAAVGGGGTVAGGGREDVETAQHKRTNDWVQCMCMFTFMLMLVSVLH